MAGASGDAGMAPARVPGAVCRINALPTEVLLRALSHLDAVEVVQTCVLSRRWRNLWRSVPRINATHHEFDGTAETKIECDVLFKAFVNRFLMLRNPVALDEFRLVYHVAEDSMDLDADSEDANLWIRHALQCNARSIDVFGWMRENELHLKSAVFDSVCFLTSLLLEYVILHPSFFRSLQMGCTLLERLILHFCTINDPEIASQTLRVLTIDNECYCTFEEPVSISIPSLIDLRFSVPGRVPLLNNMESLVTASVSVGTNDTQVDDICHFLMNLSGATDLKFYYKGTTLTMENDLDWCPKFNNLTTLALGEWCLHSNFYALIVFLQNSPNLVKLTLKFIQKYQSTERRFLGVLEERSFTCKHLQTVCLEGSKDDLMVNSLKKLLLDNGITSDQIDIID